MEDIIFEHNKLITFLNTKRKKINFNIEKVLENLKFLFK